MNSHSVRHFVSIAAICLALFLSGISGLLSSSESGEFGILRWVIVGCMFVGACCFAASMMLEATDRRFFPIYLGGFMMVATQATSFLLAGTFARIDHGRFFETIVQQILVVCWIGFGMTTDWRGPSIWFLTTLAGLGIMTANVGLWIQIGFPVPFEGLSTGKNGLAAAACSGIVLAATMLLYWRNFISFLGAGALGGISCIALLASGGRASILFLAIALFAYACWPLYRWSRIGPTLLIIGMIVLLAAIPILYVNLDQFSWFQYFDGEFAKLTHSTFSGRETLWPEVIQGISDHPIVGNGTSASWRFVRKEYGIVQELSAHNLYLAVLYQSGLIGLIGISWLFASFLYTYWKMPDSRWARIGFAIFMAALFREVWEVSLTQNTLQIGLGVWVLATLGISLGSMHDSAEEEHEDAEDEEPNSDSDSDYEEEEFDKDFHLLPDPS